MGSPFKEDSPLCSLIFWKWSIGILRASAGFRHNGGVVNPFEHLECGVILVYQSEIVINERNRNNTIGMPEPDSTPKAPYAVDITAQLVEFLHHFLIVFVVLLRFFGHLFYFEMGRHLNRSE